MTTPLLEVIAPGFLASVQDLGRFHLAHLGISPGGAADPLALRAGNLLVGNSSHALCGFAGIEMTLIGGSFLFLKDTWIALTGGNCQPRIDGSEVSMWTSLRIYKGQTLRTGAIGQGARSYLCVAGGIQCEIQLGSRSTFLGGSWGGPSGRELQSEDRLHSDDAVSLAAPRRSGIRVRSLYRSDPGELRVTRGPQADWFSAESIDTFYSSEFEVSSEANRRGIRLSGADLAPTRHEELITEGIAAGSIQIPAGGQPLILFCEQQTTGGYAKIATVIRADLFRLGQLRPGTKIRFREVSLDEAWKLNREMENLCQMSALPV